MAAPLDVAARISLPLAAARHVVTLPLAQAHTTVEVPAVQIATLFTDATALLDGITIRDTVSGALVDPTTLTVEVFPEDAEEFTLEYGTAPTSGTGDVVARTALGTFRVQVELTEARGAGVFRYRITAGGTARGVAEGSFTVKRQYTPPT